MNEFKAFSTHPVLAISLVMGMVHTMMGVDHTEHRGWILVHVEGPPWSNYDWNIKHAESSPKAIKQALGEFGVKKPSQINRFTDMMVGWIYVDSVAFMDPGQKMDQVTDLDSVGPAFQWSIRQVKPFNKTSMNPRMFGQFEGFVDHEAFKEGPLWRVMDTDGRLGGTLPQWRPNIQDEGINDESKNE